MFYACSFSWYNYTFLYRLKMKRSLIIFWHTFGNSDHSGRSRGTVQSVSVLPGAADSRGACTVRAAPAALWNGKCPVEPLQPPTGNCGAKPRLTRVKRQHYFGKINRRRWRKPGLAGTHPGIHGGTLELHERIGVACAIDRNRTTASPRSILMPGEISSLKIFLRDVRQYYFRTAILVYSCLFLFILVYSRKF